MLSHHIARTYLHMEFISCSGLYSDANEIQSWEQLQPRFAYGAEHVALHMPHHATLCAAE